VVGHRVCSGIPRPQAHGQGLGGVRAPRGQRMKPEGLLERDRSRTGCRSPQTEWSPLGPHSVGRWSTSSLMSRLGPSRQPPSDPEQFTTTSRSDPRGSCIPRPCSRLPAGESTCSGRCFATRGCTHPPSRSRRRLDSIVEIPLHGHMRQAEYGRTHDQQGSRAASLRRQASRSTARGPCPPGGASRSQFTAIFVVGAVARVSHGQGLGPRHAPLPGAGKRAWMQRETPFETGGSMGGCHLGCWHPCGTTRPWGCEFDLPQSWPELFDLAEIRGSFRASKGQVASGGASKEYSGGI
jgi:hypothetical protein